MLSTVLALSAQDTLRALNVPPASCGATRRRTNLSLNREHNEPPLYPATVYNLSMECPQVTGNPRITVDVYAEFPKDLAKIESKEYLLSSNWEWTRCLSFPVDKLCQLDLWNRPYEWIRYATGIVVGMQGHLSKTPEKDDVLDHTQRELPTESARLYYRTSDAEKRLQSPADPEL